MKINTYFNFCTFRQALKNPKAFDSGSAAMYGMAQSLPDRSIVDQITRTYLDALYVTKE